MAFHEIIVTKIPKKVKQNVNICKLWKLVAGKDCNVRKQSKASFSVWFFAAFSLYHNYMCNKQDI